MKKRLEPAGVPLEVGFEYDSEAKLQYMVSERHSGEVHL